MRQLKSNQVFRVDSSLSFEQKAYVGISYSSIFL